MSDKPLFSDMDEQERTLAPQQLPEQRARVEADERTTTGDETDPLNVPRPIPISNVDVTPSAATIVPDASEANQDLREEQRGSAPDV